MAYPKGNFYHENGTNVQTIADVAIINSTISDTVITTEDITVGTAKILSGAVIPTTEVQPQGSLYICTLTGSVGLYMNTGTSVAPTWELLAITP